MAEAHLQHSPVRAVALRTDHKSRGRASSSVSPGDTWLVSATNLFTDERAEALLSGSLQTSQDSVSYGFGAPGQDGLEVDKAFNLQSRSGPIGLEADHDS